MAKGSNEIQLKHQFTWGLSANQGFVLLKVVDQLNVLEIENELGITIWHEADPDNSILEIPLSIFRDNRTVIVFSSKIGTERIQFRIPDDD